ncbi:MAG: cupredoxin domain-containing protein, partial [Actinomycetota bacterium]
MRKWISLVVVLALPMVVASPVGAGGGPKHGSFVARALPFPAMQADVYYPGKGSCLDGIDGIHKVSEPFHALAPGTLSVSLEGLSGDWDIYVLGTDGGPIGASEAAQLLDGAEGEERVTVAVKRHQRVQMVACNWLGEAEVTVQFDFVPKTTEPSKPRDHHSGSGSERDGRRGAHEVEAAGGPVTPLWQWDPSDLQVSVGDKVLWQNETGADHHVTPYGG